MVQEDRRAEDPGRRSLKTDWVAVWAVYGAGLVCGAYMTKVSPALPLQRAEFGLTLVESGFIATVFNIMGGLVGMLAGTMCDRYGHRRLALGGLATLAVAGALGSLANGFAELLVSRFFEGIGFILFSVSATALISAAAVGNFDRLKALGIWSSYMPTGGALALLIAPLAMTHWSWRGLWAILAVAAAACFLLAARYAPAPRYGGIASLRLIRESVTRPGVVVLALLFVFYVAQWVSVMIWLPTYVVDERGGSPATASLLTALMVLANAPGNLGGGWLLGNGLPRGVLVIAASVVMGAAGAGMLAASLPDAVRYLLCLAFSTCGGAIPAAIFSGLPVHARSPEHLGTANGLVLQASQAGQFFGPIALAWLASRAGGWGTTHSAMLVFAAGGVLCGLAVARIERDKIRA